MALPIVFWDAEGKPQPVVRAQSGSAFSVLPRHLGRALLLAGRLLCGRNAGTGNGCTLQSETSRALRKSWELGVLVPVLGGPPGGPQPPCLSFLAAASSICVPSPLPPPPPSLGDTALTKGSRRKVYTQSREHLASWKPQNDVRGVTGTAFPQFPDTETKLRRKGHAWGHWIAGSSSSEAQGPTWGPRAPRQASIPAKPVADTALVGPEASVCRKPGACRRLRGRLPSLAIRHF